MIEKLKELLMAFGVEYEWISSSEILIPCPLDLLPFGANPHRPQQEIISDPEVGVQDDEACILIEERDGCLNWLIVSATGEESED